jgi:signal transduction histidine kinase
MKTFRTRLIVVLSLSVGGLATLSTAGLVIASQAFARRTLDQELLQRVRGPGPGMGRPPDGPRPGPGSGRALATGDLRRPRVFGRSGDAIGPDGLEPWDAELIPKSLSGATLLKTVERDGIRFRIASGPGPRGEDGRPVSAIQAAQELDELERFFAGQWTAVAVVAPLAILFSIAIGGALAAGILRPLDRMTRRASQMAESGERGSIPVEGDDEMARMARAMNGLLDLLHHKVESERAARSRAEVLLESQKRFTADASHELRTPLARIQLLAEGALHPDAAMEDKNRALTRSQETAAEMTRLVEQLLALARADAGASVLTEARTPFHILAAQAVEAAALSEAPEVRLLGPTTEVLGDAVLLRQALVNLLVNARRASPAGSPITIFCDHGRIGVQDSGIGFPPDQLERVGERFHRVQESRARSQGGHGLGLAIAASVAGLHGGRLEARNRPEGGAEVALVLPGSRFAGTSQVPHAESPTLTQAPFPGAEQER